jgi:hypothetical protein
MCGEHMCTFMMCRSRHACNQHGGQRINY